MAYEGAVTISNADMGGCPLRLDVSEAAALLVALRTLADVPGLADRDALDRTIANFERAASDAAEATGRVAVEVEAEEQVVPVAPGRARRPPAASVLLRTGSRRGHRA